MHAYYIHENIMASCHHHLCKNIPNRKKLVKLLAGLVTIIVITSFTAEVIHRSRKSKCSENCLQGKCSTELFPAPTALANIPDFRFLLNHDICQNDTVDLLILVGSYPGNIEMRGLIRGIYGAPRMDRYVVKLVFLFGLQEYFQFQDVILEESTRHRDVVQGTFSDNYDNVTIRDIMGLRWTWRQCPQARFVMHIDDDVSFDIDMILEILDTKIPNGTDYVACFHMLGGNKVFREGHYAVSKEVHPADVFADYCPGWIYWFSTGAAKQLDNMALKHVPYRMNDAYITGTLVAALGWKHINLELSYLVDFHGFQKHIENPVSTPPYVLGDNGGNVTLARLVYERFHRRATREGIPRTRPTRVKNLCNFR